MTPTTIDLAEQLLRPETRVAELAGPTPGGHDHDLRATLRTVETLER